MTVKTMDKKTNTETKKEIKNKYDVIVVGGGPSGSSAATFLGMQGKDVLLVDRAKFPRDKTCGDGISGKSVGILRELGLTEEIQNFEHTDMYGVTFSSPKGTVIEIPSPKNDAKGPPGYVCRREVFDNILLKNAKKYSTVVEQFFVDDLLKEEDKVVGISGTNMMSKEKMTIKANVVVCADGVGGITTRKLGAVNSHEEHQVSALRAYYDNVEGMSDKIELHFVEEALPGYFWIFPLPNKKANVGIGMLVSDMKKRVVNLEKVMYNIIENHPMFKERFIASKKISEIKRWQLPLGSWRPKVYGNGYVLVGDCASLIDPFTGEGIGNGLVSGKIAAKIIKEAFEKNDFSETSLSGYQRELYAEVGPELKTSYNLQRLGTQNWLLNWLVDKAARSQKVREAISASLINPEAQKQFQNPLFYLKILFS